MTKGCNTETQISFEHTQHQDKDSNNNTSVKRVSNQVELLAVNPANAYNVVGSIGVLQVNFMLDTGASVSLLSEETWQRCTTNMALATCEHELVGVEGSKIATLGVATLDVSFAGVMVTGDFIVAKSLHTEAILGLDFLENNGCIINTEQHVLNLHGRAIPLRGTGERRKSTSTINVALANRLEIPPRCQIEIMATVGRHKQPLEKDWESFKDWLVEPLIRETLVIAANAVVKPQVQNGIQVMPLRLINPTREAVVLHKGTSVAQISPITHSTVIASVDSSTDISYNRSPDKNVTQAGQEHLWALVEANRDLLTEEQQQQLYKLLLGYADVFAFNDEQLGRTDKLQHTINTGDNQPIRQRARRTPIYQREQVHQLLQDMLSQDIITPSTSPWASPIVLVKKKDGSWRFCVDYRKLNAITQKDAYPLPRIDDTMDTLSGSQWFSTLDLRSGYWQVEVSEEDRQKTAFTTHEGLFEFKVMPFGLCNAPATFQRLMDLLLAGLQWSQCLVYLDDIIVPGRSFHEHLANLAAVLQRIKGAGLRLKPSKCVLCQETVSYLGHILSRSGVATDPEKTAKVASWPTPNSVQEVQQFLGLASYYRRFVKKFAEIAKPLYRLTERGRQFSWTNECETAFAMLKSRLTSTPILAFPDFTKPFILDTDASQEGIGAVLSQECDGKEAVIAYASRTLSKPERRYCVTRKELLAVVTFIHHFRPYLLGRPFMLRTDHSSLAWLQSFKEPEGQLARWMERLQEYNFTIVHRQGSQHRNADALSRRPNHQEYQPQTPIHPNTGEGDNNENTQGIPLTPTASPVVVVTAKGDDNQNDNRQEQLDDEIIQPILEGKETDRKPTLTVLSGRPRETYQLLQQWDQLELHNGVLYRRYENHQGNQHHLQLVVPRSMQQQVLHESHSGSVGGHLGEAKTLSRIRERFFWPGYSHAVKEWCQTCKQCAARKTPYPRRHGALQNMTAGYPMQMVAADIMGPLPKSKNGNRYVLVASDYFTRWAEAYAIPNQEAITVATKLVDNMFCRYSIPEQLHSDMGAQFESQVMKQVCEILHINKTHTTPYHPQGDGLVERLNRTIQGMLATAVKEHSEDWEDHLPKVCFAYNTSEHSSTGFTPFHLMYGRQARMPLDIIYGLPPGKVESHCQYASSLRHSLENAYQLARINTKGAARRQKEHFNLKVHGKPYVTGDFVWLCNPVIPKGTSRKLHSPWKGPYKVIKRISDIVYRIQDTQGRKKKQVVHFDRLKPYYADREDPPTNTRQQLEPSAMLDTNDEVQRKDSTAKPSPPGTHLQINDNYEDETNETDIATIPQDESQNRRYPLRMNRRRPSRYPED